MNKPVLYCRKCGTKINVNERYCYKCGIELVPLNNTPAKDTYPGASKQTKISVIGDELKKFLINENRGKIAILVFLIASLLMNIFLVPWVRTFPDKKIKNNPPNIRQVEYGNIFYIPSKFSDGLSPDNVGEKSKYGVSLNYDYSLMALHEVYLGIIVGVGYIVLSLKKK
ncbi:zinc ribbon domain-containing protein [uncultured Anaerovibrio sp.]|uniref:zinc ribbon domain-containing protein n=1 Tax=uncultured Anaerovibrio sp. TaxID=361586 RepID=UPI0025E78D95|nr:zinc ribbon domain-containing protein [uncultured Anaerovibrio sp.]